jgi:hypothetical protein
MAAGSWKGNSTLYAPYTRPSAGLYDEVTGAWTGGFNAATVEDECSVGLVQKMKWGCFLSNPSSRS